MPDNPLADEGFQGCNGRDVFQKERVDYGLQENRQRGSRMAARKLKQL